MITLEPPHRSATLGDAAVLAELVNIAGEGLPLYLWTKMADTAHPPWAIGRDRAKRENGGFSYRNAVVREGNGGVVACLIGYPLDDDAEPIDYQEMPPMFVPLQQLEDAAPGTWYINVLATYPNCRGNGYGGQLLDIAEQLARDVNKEGLSIIVSDANAGARRLYEKHGYRGVDTRPMVKESWDNPGRNWVLLVKRIR